MYLQAKQKNILLSLVLLLISFTCANTIVLAQSVGINNTGSIPDSCSILDIESTSKGLLIPRMNINQRDSISTPKEGLTIYQNDQDQGYYVFQNNRWGKIGESNSSSALSLGKTDNSYTELLVNNNYYIVDSSAIFYDPGGPLSNYDNNQSDTVYFYTDGNAYGAYIKLEQMDMEPTYDSLIIDGRLFSNTETDSFYTNKNPISIIMKTNHINTKPGFKLVIDGVYENNNLDTNEDIPINGGWFYNSNKNSMYGGVQLGPNWHYDSLGLNSFQYGNNTSAKGNWGAIALGNNSRAQGNYGSIAIGNNINNKGNYGSVALGRNNNISYVSSAVAIGIGNSAFGSYSTVLGRNNLVSGTLSSAIGFSNIVKGSNGSYALGYVNTVSGNDGAGAIGYGLFSNANNGLVIGLNNDSLVTAGSTASDRPLFIIGTGSSSIDRRNGLEFSADGKLKLTQSNNSYINLLNDSKYTHYYGDQVFGNGGGNGLIASNEGASETAGFYFDGNSTAIWSPGDGSLGQPNAIIYFLDEDGFSAANDNPYDNGSLKAYINSSGAYMQVSDQNKKQNIQRLTNALPSILALNGYNYNFKLQESEIQKGDKPKPSSGLLAQELKKIIPNAVEENDSGELFVNYASLVPFLIESIKELNSKIETLESNYKSLLKSK